MKPLSLLLTVAVLLAGIVSCSFVSRGGSKSSLRSKDEAAENPLAATAFDTFEEPAVATGLVVPDTFLLPHIPETLVDPFERAAYLVMHYWDRFDFTNRGLIDRPDITEQAFVNYIDVLHHVPMEKADESLVYTLEKASADTAMYIHFGAMFEKYLYDFNSPFRNEEMYLPVIEQLEKSPLIPEERKSSLRFQKEMAQKNRVGTRAANFSYTLPSGKSHELHKLTSEYTLLIFSNPGCNTCEAVIERLTRSNEVNRALSLNNPGRTMLTILTVYPDEDLDEWLAHLPKMPANWVHGYDKGMKISREKLYDIRAIPTIFLLDKDKKVILKDVSVDAVELYFR
jgi:hypothetical protein